MSYWYSLYSLVIESNAYFQDLESVHIEPRAAPDIYVDVAEAGQTGKIPVEENRWQIQYRNTDDLGVEILVWVASTQEGRWLRLRYADSLDHTTVVFAPDRKHLWIS